MGGVREHTQEHNYLIRKTAADAYVHLARTLPPEQCGQVVGLITDYCADPVANVRLRACTALQELDEAGRITDYSNVVAALRKCETDNDIDVRYFGGKVLTLISPSDTGKGERVDVQTPG